MNTDSIMEAAKRKIGPLPAWAWGVVAAAGIWVYRSISGSSTKLSQGDTTYAPNPSTNDVGGSLGGGAWGGYDPSAGYGSGGGYTPIINPGFGAPYDPFDYIIQPSPIEQPVYQPPVYAPSQPAPLQPAPTLSPGVVEGGGANQLGGDTVPLSALDGVCGWTAQDKANALAFYGPNIPTNIYYIYLDRAASICAGG